jgi:hypothetical protein
MLYFANDLARSCVSRVAAEIGKPLEIDKPPNVFKDARMDT